MNGIAYVGVDVQMNRGCSCAVLDSELMPYHSEWLLSPDRIRSLVSELLEHFDRVAVGIDAPRCPLPKPREYYWRDRRWRLRQPEDQGRGRHCEVVVASLRLGNPQYTPLAGDCPDWMELASHYFLPYPPRQMCTKCFLRLRIVSSIRITQHACLLVLLISALAQKICLMHMFQLSLYMNSLPDEEIKLAVATVLGPLYCREVFLVRIAVCFSGLRHRYEDACHQIAYAAGEIIVPGGHLFRSVMLSSYNLPPFTLL